MNLLFLGRIAVELEQRILHAMAHSMASVGDGTPAAAIADAFHVRPCSADDRKQMRCGY